MSPVPDEDHDKNDSDDIENIESPNLVIPDGIDDSDDIEDYDADQGYELLPQGPDDLNGNDSNTDSDGNSELSEGEVEGQVIGDVTSQATGLAPGGLYPNFPQGELPSYLQVPQLPRSDRKDILWNQPRMNSAENMDSGKISAIKSAMQGFQLPVSNIPHWAVNISEENWKEQLVSRMSSCGSDDCPLAVSSNSQSVQCSLPSSCTADQSALPSDSHTIQGDLPSNMSCHSVKEAD